jgi:hypothetical protein
MIINVTAASQNGAIQKVLRELKGAGSADPAMIQKLADVDVTDIGNVDNKLLLGIYSRKRYIVRH